MGQGIYQPRVACTSIRKPHLTTPPACRPGDGVSAERLLLNLHSGRWLGRAGVWLMDAAAIVLLVLAATGAVTVWRRWRG